MPEGMKTLYFMCNAFISCIEISTFMWVKDCCRKGIPIDYNIIWEKAKSIYDNLKQKEGEGSKAV